MDQIRTEDRAGNADPASEPDNVRLAFWACILSVSFVMLLLGLPATLLPLPFAILTILVLNNGAVLGIVRYYGCAEVIGLRRGFAPVWAVPLLLFTGAGIFMSIQVADLMPHAAPPVLHVIAAGLALASAPLWEEIVFRGLFREAFGRRSMLRGMFISSIIFGLIHGAGPGGMDIEGWLVPVTILLASLAGAALYAMREFSGSLLLPILAHAGYNLPNAGWYAAQMGPGTQPGIDQIGMTGIVMVASALAAALLVSILIGRRNRARVPASA